MIPFIDLKAQYAKIEDDVRQGMDAVLNHGRYIMGPEIEELEKKLAAYCGVRHAVGCASGTDALLMALMAHKVGPGDVIFTSPFTFMATAEVVSLLGAVPVFVDIEEDTFNMDVMSLKAALMAVKQCDPSIHPLPKELRGPGACEKVRAKGVIPVDIFGLPTDYDAINDLADEFGLFVISDAAQSFGGEYKGRKSCSLAPMSCTSFFPAKPLGCYGDGGAVFAEDDDMLELLKSIRIHGQGRDKYENVRIGINGRLDSIQAAVLLAKLKIFDDELQARQKVAAAYNERLGKISGLTVPTVPDNYLSAWAQYSIRHPERSRIQAELSQKGVPTAIYYPVPLHLQPAYAYLGYDKGDMPVSEAVAQDIFSLPMHPYLDEKAMDTICAAVAGAVGEKI